MSMRIAAGLAAIAACNLNESGNLGATKLGDTSHPLATGSPIADLRAACGEGTTLDVGAVRREPYLQQVTQTSAKIGWVSLGADAARVDVALPAEASVMSADAETESGIARSAGEVQMWASLGPLFEENIHCYQLHAGGTALAEPTGFRTAPFADNPDPIRFLAFGDSGGGGSDQMALRDRMFEYPYDLMIHTGDVAYDDGTIGEFEDNVFGVYRELFKNIPFFPAAGNHDHRTDRGAPFRQVFALPGGEQWYSFDWGRVHFAALDTEADYATQIAWLDQDLAASPLPWKIVYMHRPPYSSGAHGSDTSLRTLLAPVVERHGVQLVLAGHDHNYERMIPQNGVAYAVTGGGGRGTRNVSESSFTAFSDEVIHFVVVEVFLEELILHAIDATGVEFDSLVVPRVR